MKARKKTRKADILLAEDNSINQMIAIKILEKHGFRVDAVVNGQEAVDLLNSRSYDLVLMDCQMPDVDGYDATRMIRMHEDAAIASIPIVAMTAHAMPGDREKCLACGMDDYIAKPIKPEALVAIVHENLKKSQAS